MLDKVKSVLEEEGLLDSRRSIEERLALAIKHPFVRETFEFMTPRVDDLTGLLPVTSGRVYAVRNDLTPNVDNHKKQVVGALILRGVLTGRLPAPGVDTLIDGGNFSSASAVKYFSKKFGMKGVYVMSRLFPEDVLGLLRAEHFSVIQAPANPSVPIEREFYGYLWHRLRDPEFRRNKFFLFHPRYAGQVSYPLGLELAQTLPRDISCVLSGLGAGTTLEGTQIPIQDYFVSQGLRKPRIFVAEHKLSPLFSEKYPERVFPLESIDFGPYVDSSRSFAGVPHAVIGPHYEEIASLLRRRSVARIDKVVSYSENDWKSTQNYLAQRGVSIGNSSAANVNTASRLAALGEKVLTVIFEPCRQFYKK